MSGLPPIPPRPDRTKARSPAPASAPVPAPPGSGSTLGSDIPAIPPRPKRRIDRSQSPSKAQTSSTEESASAVPSTNISIQDGGDVLALNTPVSPPRPLDVPVLRGGAEEREQEHTPVPEFRAVSDDLELGAPEPTVPKLSNTEKSEKLEAITRTDSAQAAQLDLEGPQEENKLASPQLQPETHTAIMESLGQPQNEAEMEGQVAEPDLQATEPDELARNPAEVGDDNVVHVAEPKNVPSQPQLSQEQKDVVEEQTPDQNTAREAEEKSSIDEPNLPPRKEVERSVISDLEPSIIAAHSDGVHVNISGVQLEETSTGNEHAENKLPSPQQAEETIQDTSAPHLHTSKQIKAVPEPLKLGSNVEEHFGTAETEDNNDAEKRSLTAPQDGHQTDKNEVDEIMGTPVEPVTAADLKRECALEDSSESNGGSPPEVSQFKARETSLENVSDIRGEQIDTHLPEERPTTGAVTFHQEKKAEGIPLSNEEGRATTGVAAVISKPAIPPRPAKKLTDPKPLESKPIPVPVLPQTDGPPPAGPTTTLPSGPKPPVPLASKPAIPPRPARPPRPVKKDSLNGSEGAPLTTVSSASSARSLFEAGGPEAIAAAKAKPKPPVPARPIGNKIAALQGGFMSELNKRLKVGPTAPAKEEKKEEEEVVEEKKEVKPLADARKGRARGPARRPPAKVEKATSPNLAAAPAAPKQEFSCSAPVTVWEVDPEHGDIKLPSRTATPKKEEGDKPGPEVEVKSDAPEVTELKPEIAEEALKVTQEETRELAQAERDIRATTPPQVEQPQQEEPQPLVSSWTGTTALGAVAMSAREVIEQTAATASKTIKDFTEGEEHVLSDVEDKGSLAGSEVDSSPASPRIPIQADSPSQAERKAEVLAAPENANPAEAQVPSEIPSALPPKLEETQHPSETDYPPPLMSSEAPTVLRSPDSAETEVNIETAAAKLAAPENAFEPLGVSNIGVLPPEPETGVVGDVPVPATSPADILPATTVEQLKELNEIEGERPVPKMD